MSSRSSIAQVPISIFRGRRCDTFCIGQRCGSPVLISCRRVRKRQLCVAWHCLSRSIGKKVHISPRRIRKQSTRVTQAEHASCNSKQAPHPEKLEESVYTCLASEWQGRFSSIRVRLHRKANENALFVFQSLRSLMLQNAMFYNTFWPSGFKMLCFTIRLLHAKCIKPQNHWFYNTFSACGPLKLQNALFYNIFAANPSRQASNCFVLQYFRFGKVGPYH